MDSAEKLPNDLYDIIIIGAGISGINTAYRIQTDLPSARYTILEARGGIGGTWDLFRYPGFRSDSDLYTFGFTWHPWAEQKIIADGDTIRNYMRKSAARYGIEQKIKFHRKLLSANWSSGQQAWDLLVDEDEGRTKTHFYARFVVLGTGYYDYDEPLSSPIPGIENFTGTVIHPQFWPEDLDYKDKKIVVVGSGSTAVTLIPSLANTASHVTMLQRSPSYILARPAIDPFNQWAQKFLPTWLAHRLTRLKVLLLSFLFLKLCALYPLTARNVIRKATLKHLPDTTPHDPHFSPHYNPWEQRLCLAPDGDFFHALRAGKASVITDTIKAVTPTSIQLSSGQTLTPDIIVTATGLKLKLAGGARITINNNNNNPITINDKYLWNGAMLQDVPNMATVIGYTNASWTLGAETTAHLVSRLLRYMQAKGYSSATPRLAEGQVRDMKKEPALNLSSTYIVRGAKELPRTGNWGPWRGRSSYFWDLWRAKFGDVTEGLEFEKVLSLKKKKRKRKKMG